MTKNSPIVNIISFYEEYAPFLIYIHFNVMIILVTVSYILISSESVFLDIYNDFSS